MKNPIMVPHFEDTVKTFDALVAMRSNLFNGCLKDKIFYLHLHKCGGTSIASAIKSCYRSLDNLKERSVFHLNGQAAVNAAQKSVAPPDFPSEPTDEDYLQFKFKENLLLYYMCQKNIKYIAGHFSFSATAYQYFFDKYAFITVLRDPVKRWISAYFYSRYKNGHRQMDMEITEFLKSELALKGGSIYVKHLGGIDKMGDYTSEEAVNRAKENLHKFSIVGCLEYKKDFLNQFEERFGRRLKIREFNQSPKPDNYRKSIVTEEIEEQIRAICRPDIEIYQYAIDNFVKTKD